MRKNILKLLAVFIFLITALFIASFLQNIKHIYKQEAIKDNKNNVYSTYENVKDFDYGFNLPVITIDTNGGTIVDGDKINAYMQVYDNGNKDNYLTDEPKLSSNINIEIRGNTTTYFPKKQYSVGITNKKGEPKDEKLLGMKKNSDWVINGPFSDKSLMRNYIAYTTAGNIMEYAPKVKFCEVFVIDDDKNTLEKKHYKGVYMLIEKIKNGENRVDIAKSQDNRDETSFIIAKDRNKEDDIFIKTYGYETYLYDYGININYPINSLTPNKYNYINNYISEFERILYSDKFNDPYEGYEKYIDVDSFVDFYILNEFFYNTDAGILSTYFYKDYNSKMKAGPIWDFNRSLGNNQIRNRNAFEHEGFFMHERSWFDRLMEDYRFSSKVVDRYKELREMYLSEDYLIDMIDENVAYLGEAVNRNTATWPIYMQNQDDMLKLYGDYFKPYEYDPQVFDKFLKENEDLYEPTTGKAMSYEEEIKFMKNFIKERGKWMDENIDTLSKWSKY